MPESSDNDLPVGVPPLAGPGGGDPASKPAQSDAPGGASDAERDTDASGASVAADQTAGARPGDDGLGTPLMVSGDARRLSPRELEQLEQQRAAEDRANAERVLDELMTDGTGFRLPSFLRGPVMLVIAALAGLFGMFVVNQVVTTLSALQTVEPALRWVVVGVMVVCGLLILYVIVRLFGLLLRLRPNRQIRVKVLEELAARHGWQARALARERQAEARDDLQAYLKSFPLDDGEAKRLRTAGLTTDEVATLLDERRRLLDPNLAPDAAVWLQEYRVRFQKVLDEAATRRVREVRWKVGLATAVAPYAVFDTSIVIYHSFALIADLCSIYNLRGDNFSTAVLLGKVMLNTYVAGNLQDLTGKMGDVIADELAGHMGKVGGKLAGMISSRLTEGSINAFMINRLGGTTIALLRPIRAE